MSAEIKNSSILLLFILICISNSLNAQDIHFSQYMTAPQIINASLAGYYNEDWRITVNYRRQWAALGNPLTTNSISADAPFYLQDKKFAAGIIFINDNSPIVSYRQNQFFTNFAFHQILGKQYFRIGIQPGVSFNSYNPDQLRLPEQYNMYTGLYDASIPMSEDLSDTKTAYFDVNTGVSWTTNIRNITILSGLSAFHINKPHYGFNDDKIVPVRWLFVSRIEASINPFVEIMPTVIIVKQATARELLVGSQFEFKLKHKIKDINSIYSGLYFRHSLFKNFDAAILSVGLNYSKIEINIAYDILVSELRTVTQYRGSVELSIVFKGLLNKNKVNNIPCTIQ
jgi:type IX secretion system PorP/SprF family membrane protein